MNLNTVFLQLEGLFDIFRSQSGGITDPTGPNLISEIVIPIGAFIAFIFILIKVYTVWNSKRQYTGDGRPLGRFKILIQDGHFLVGNLSKYEIPFLPKTKKILSDVPYMKKVIEHLETLVKERQLFAYEMRITDDTYSDFRGNKKDILIISSDELESDRISWVDRSKDSKSGLMSAIVEPSKIVFSFVTSRYHDILTPDNDIQDVYVISPIPMFEEGEKKPFGFSEAEFLKKQHYLTIKQLQQSEELSEAVMYMEAVSLAEEKLDAKDRRIDELTDLNAELHEIILDHSRREDILRLRLNEQPIVGLTNPFTIPERGEPWAWHIMFAVAPLAGFLIVPEFGRNFPAWLGAIMGLVTMIGIRYISLRKENIKEDQIVRTGVS